MTDKEIEVAEDLKKVFRVFKKTMEVAQILRGDTPFTEGEQDMINLHDKMLEELDNENVDFDRVNELLIAMEVQADINKSKLK